MSTALLISLSELLHPEIEQESTVIRSPVGVLKKETLACTFHYLCDEGRLLRVANNERLESFSVDRDILGTVIL